VVLILSRYVSSEEVAACTRWLRTQFSGFNDRCPDFPYDFAEMRHRSSLRAAYMSMGDFARAIDSRAYDRPAAHIERLGQLRLSSLTLATLSVASW
jgi:hypothetical protein